MAGTRILALLLLVLAPSTVLASEPSPPLPHGVLVRGGTMRLFNGRVPTCLTFSPDGRILASGDEDGRAHLWDRGSGKELRLGEHDGEVWCIQFLPDSKTVLTAGSDQCIRFWDPATGKELRHLEGHQGAIWSLALGSDGKTLASGSSDGTVRLWDLATGKQIRCLVENQGDVFAVAFAPDGNTLATVQSRDILAGEGADAIHLWDPATGKKLRTLEGHEGRIRALAFAPDGKFLATAAEDGPVRLWEAGTGKLARSLPGHQDGARCVTFTSDGRRLVSGGADGHLRRWDVASGKEVDHREAHEAPVCSLAFSPDGQFLASGGEDHYIINWLAADLSGHHDRIRHVALSPDSRLFATASRDRSVRVWDMGTGRQVASFEIEEPLDALAFHPNGRNLVGMEENTCVRVWDMKTGKEVRKYQLRGEEESVLPIQLSADGSRFSAQVGNGLVILSWDALTGKALPTITLDVFDASSLARHEFSPDGKFLFIYAEADRMESVMVARIEVATGKELARDIVRFGRSKKEENENAREDRSDLDEPKEDSHTPDIYLTPDGRHLVLTRFPTETTATLWDVVTGRRLQKWEGYFPENGLLRLSPTGKLLATPRGADDPDLHLTELLSGQECARLSGVGSRVQNAIFAPDGRHLVTLHEDLTFSVWDLVRQAQEVKPATELSAKELEAQWAALADPDAGRAWRARWALAAASKSAVPFLHKQLQFPADQERLAKLLVDLESSKFPIRRQAELDLEGLGAVAEPALREALTKKPTLDLKRRLENIQKNVKTAPTTPAVLRLIRAVEVLEHADTPEARDTLRALAERTPAVRVTEVAREAVARMKARGNE